MKGLIALTLLVALGCGPMPAPSPSPSAQPAMAAATTMAATTESFGCNPSDQEVTVTLFDNSALTGNQCDVKNVKPHVVAICAKYTITWSFVSTCASDVTVEIGARSRLYPHGTKDDPIDTTNFSSTASVMNGSATITARIADNAEEALYKYPIIVAGRIVDPEIDVRRGETPHSSPRPPSPSPSTR